MSPPRSSPADAAWLLALAAALPGQGQGLDALVERTVAELADPARSTAAARRLAGLGPTVVPMLRDLLHHRNAAKTTPAQRGTLLYVLGLHGKAALPAVPELRDLVRGSDELLASQAMWVLGRVAPFLDDEVGAAIREEVLRSSARRDNRAGVLMELLRLGREPGELRLVAALRRRSVECVAACQWLVAHADTPPKDPVVRDTIEQQLRLFLQRPAVVFDWSGRIEPPELAEAWLAVTRAPLDAWSARGLLTHWHPDQRRRAVAWLHEHGATLPAMERVDLALRLWDGDRDIATAAAEALAAWGAAGLVGLAPLRTLARTHDDLAVRARCAAAADAVVAACSGWPVADRELVVAVDACLQQRTATPPTAEASEAGGAAIASLLHLTAWSPAPAVAATLDCLRADPPHPSIVAAVYGLGCARDAAVARAALAWLSHHAAAVRDLVATRTDQGLAWECEALARSWTADDARRAAIEATSWFRTDGVEASELTAALQSPNTRLVARVLAELIARGTVPDDLVEAVQRLRELPDDTPLRVLADGPVHAVLLVPTIRKLAVLALAVHGTRSPDDALLTAWAQRACGTTLADLPQWVAASRATGKLAALVDALEADCRAALGLPTELRWPSVRSP